MTADRRLVSASVSSPLDLIEMVRCVEAMRRAPPNRALANACSRGRGRWRMRPRERSEEHTSELQSLMRISYAVFCLKKKKTTNTNTHSTTQQTYTTSNTIQNNIN